MRRRLAGTGLQREPSAVRTCAYYEIDFADVARFVEANGPFPRGHRCNAVAAFFDQLMRGWLCETHANANQRLRAIMPPEVAELALMLANADLDDDALETILSNELDQRASRLEAFLMGTL